MNRENETLSLAIDGLRGIAAKPIETPVVKRTPWSFTGGDDDSDAQSMATTVSDDCSKSAYLRLCDDVECALEDLIVGVDDLSAWKNNIISLCVCPRAAVLSRTRRTRTSCLTPTLTYSYLLAFPEPQN